MVNCYPKNINLGIQILRMICCFHIILTHFYHFYNIKFLEGKHKYCLSIFFFISFYFSYNTLSSKNIPKIKGRFKKMIVPYIGWPILFFGIDKFGNYFLKEQELYNLKDLYYQILLGCPIYRIFWFLFNLIILSLFFTLIIRIFNKKYIFILFVICFLDYYYFYYCNAKIVLFNNYNGIPVHHSIKPIFEYFIYVFTGFYLAYIQILNKLYKFRRRVIIISIAIIIIFLKYYYIIFSRIHYFYHAIVKNIFVCLLFILLSLIPFDNINHYYLNIYLFKLTNYTGGIYYLHAIIGRIFRKNISINKNNTFMGCMLIYIVCYLLCVIGNFIFKKSFVKYLFI